MNNSIKISGLFALALLSTAAFASMPARADDDGTTDESAAQQLRDNEHSGQDAVQAPSDEAAKDLASQGWDTPNNDPAPAPDNNGDGN